MLFCELWDRAELERRKLESAFFTVFAFHVLSGVHVRVNQMMHSGWPQGDSVYSTSDAEAAAAASASASAARARSNTGTYPLSFSALMDSTVKKLAGWEL